MSGVIQPWARQALRHHSDEDVSCAEIFHCATFNKLHFITVRISNLKWNCCLYTISALQTLDSVCFSSWFTVSKCQQTTASKISAPTLKLRSEVDSALLHLQQCFYFRVTAWCQRPTLASSALDSTTGEQTAHVKLFIFHRTALLAETYTLYQLSQQRSAQWLSTLTWFTSTQNKTYRLGILKNFSMSELYQGVPIWGTAGVVFWPNSSGTPFLCKNTKIYERLGVTNDCRLYSCARSSARLY